MLLGTLSAPVVEIPGLFGALGLTITGYGILTILCGFASFGIYIARLLKRNQPPPISSWGLWFLIDFLAMYAEFGRGVISAQLMTYTAGSFIVCSIIIGIILLRRPTVVWDWTWDTLTVIASGVAVIAWTLSGNPTAGLWLSLLAMWIAAGPMIVGLYNRKIKDEPMDSWAFVLLGCVFSYLDGLIITSITLGLLQVVIITLIERAKSRQTTR